MTEHRAEFTAPAGPVDLCNAQPEAENGIHQSTDRHGPVLQMMQRSLAHLQGGPTMIGMRGARKAVMFRFAVSFSEPRDGFESETSGKQGVCNTCRV